MNVGINDGDVFLQDDPWIGTNHQMDTAVYAPVFVGRPALRLGLQRHPPARARGGRARRLHPAGARRVLRADLLPADEARRRAASVREDVVDAVGAPLAPPRADDARAALADRRRRVRPRRASWSMVERYGAAAGQGHDAQDDPHHGRASSASGCAGSRTASGATPLRRRRRRRRPQAVLRQPDGAQGGRPAHLLQQGHRPQRRLLQHHRRRAAAPITNSLLTFLCYDQYLCARGAAASSSTSTSSAGRSPPPTTRPRSAPRSGCRRARAGPVPAREDAVRRPRDRAATRSPRRGCARWSTTTPSGSTSTARRRRTSRWTAIVGGARRVPLARRPRPRRHDELDDEPGRQRRGDRARDAVPLPLPRASARLGRPRPVARRRLPRLRRGRPPLAGALHLLGRPARRASPRASACSAAGPRRAARCGTPTTRDVRDWFAAGSIPGSPEELRELVARAAAWRRRRSSTTGSVEDDVFEVMPEPGRRLRRPAAARARDRSPPTSARAG